MARPKKETVDYFPHIIKHGKTITILENRFGNDGYAFWFKLLEILGSTKGHSYRYENTTNIEFLLAKTNVSQDKAEKILNLLADLDAIDKELWENNIIWSDNFVENIEDVYRKRSNGQPQKPVIDNQNPIDEELSQRKQGKNEVNDNENSQTKLKETKLKETKLNSDGEAEKFDRIKKDNGRYKYPDNFEEIWEVYPRSINKKQAWIEWQERIKDDNINNQDLLDAVKKYAKECEINDTEKRYIKYPQTFLGSGGYWEEYENKKIKNNNKIADF